MSILDQLKPVQKFRVMDLLINAGFEVDHWKDYKGKSPAANPNYCYNWAFEQPGEAVAVCLWHDSLKQSGETVFFLRERRVLGSGGGVRAAIWNGRDTQFGRHLELAFRQKLPVRVIVVDGEQRVPGNEESDASRVAARLLDPESWAVTEFNENTGECRVVRGLRPVGLPIESPDVELAWQEGEKRLALIGHRHREAEARRKKIQSALKENGGRLICQVPNCGFDFVERYGSLGQGYAQVHHLQPLSKAPGSGQKVRLDDLVIVCANCHAMIHWKGECRPLEGLIIAS